MFDSTNKKIKRNSILRNNNRCLSHNKQQQSTALGFSVKFKQIKNQQDQQQQHQTPKQFKQHTTQKKALQINDLKSKQNLKLRTQQQTYDKWDFIKDINNLNSAHNHILMMLSTHFCKGQEGQNKKITAKQQNLIQQIKKQLLQNIEIKAQLDKKLIQINNIYQISHYLHISPQQFIQKEAENFFINFQNKEKQIQLLQMQLKKLEYRNANKSKFNKNQSVRQKQQNCKMYMKKIQKQNKKVQMLQAQQKKLLKQLYKTQKDVLKNEKSNSALKLKINQIQDEQQYRKIRARTRITSGDGKNKQNVAVLQNNDKGNGNLIKKNVKIQSTQRLKCSKSLNKFIKKRVL